MTIHNHFGILKALTADYAPKTVKQAFLIQ